MTTFLLFGAVVAVILLLAVLACWQWWVAVSLREELKVARRQVMEQLEAAKALREHGVEGWLQSDLWCQKWTAVKTQLDDAVAAERIASQALEARDVELGRIQTAMMKVEEEFEKIKMQHEALQRNAVASSERWGKALGAWDKWAVMEGGSRLEGMTWAEKQAALSAELQAARSASFQAQGGEVVL
jgi:hypothetical protein